MIYRCKCGNDNWKLEVDGYRTIISEKIVEFNIDEISGDITICCCRCGNKREIVPETPVALQIDKDLDDCLESPRERMK